MVPLPSECLRQRVLTLPWHPWVTKVVQLYHFHPSQVSGSLQPGVGRQVSGWRQRVPKNMPKLAKTCQRRAPGVEQSPARRRAPGDKTPLRQICLRGVFGTIVPPVEQSPAVGAYRLPAATASEVSVSRSG